MGIDEFLKQPLSDATADPDEVASLIAVSLGQLAALRQINKIAVAQAKPGRKRAPAARKPRRAAETVGTGPLVNGAEA